MAMPLVRVQHGAMRLYLPEVHGPVEVRLPDGATMPITGAGPEYQLPAALWAACPQPPRGRGPEVLHLCRVGAAELCGVMEVRRRKWSQ